MVNFVPISASRHTGRAWRRPTSFVFASAQAVVPLVGKEFAAAAVAMPIAFIKQASEYVPVAMMSPVTGRNLFIGPGGQWLGAYVPAALRSYPFRLGRVEGSDQVTLCIDEDCGLIIDADGTAEEFIGPDGNSSVTTRNMLDFLVAMEHSRTTTESTITALTDAGLIQPWPLQVTMDGRAMPANGLFRVDEAALNTLDDAAFLTLRRAGALTLAYLQLISMSQVAVFEQLNLVQQQLLQAYRQQQPPSVDEFFARAKNETLSFT